MKYLKKILLSFTCLAILSIDADAQQDSTGMPGDNFSLQGALEMFKQASSPEEFEKLINGKDKNVNNLDLNGDGEIDYIRVIDKADKNVHAFILQIAVSESENQDIAVIELEKTGDETADLQIIGDEDIFGEQVIVEASEEGDEILEDNNSGKGPQATLFETYRIIVNVYYWPIVRLVYQPVYKPYVSQWKWHFYPNWWKPWRPITWQAFHPLRLHYSNHFAIVHTHRVVTAHRIYTPYRTTSFTVRSRTTVAHNNYRVSRTTRRTAVTGPGGNTHVRTTQHTTIQRNGNNKGGNNDNGDGNKKGKGKRG